MLTTTSRSGQRQLRLASRVPYHERTTTALAKKRGVATLRRELLVEYYVHVERKRPSIYVLTK